VAFVKAKQPVLPRRMPDGRAWPARTRAWWRRWGRDPRAKRFDAAAWDDLLDTAVIHGQLWSGDWKAASELRLRTAKYGVTPEDRARMRVTLSDGLEDVPAGAASAVRARTGRARAVRRSACRGRHGESDLMPWRGPAYEGELPTLGFEVLDWITEYLIVPDGPSAGEPLVLTGAGPVRLNFYAIDPAFTGRRCTAGRW
jgi:hypothetical protein